MYHYVNYYNSVAYLIEEIRTDYWCKLMVIKTHEDAHPVDAPVSHRRSSTKFSSICFLILPINIPRPYSYEIC